MDSGEFKCPVVDGGGLGDDEVDLVYGLSIVGRCFFLLLLGC